MSLFRLDSSVQGENSTSRQVADTAQKAWAATSAGGVVVSRDLAADPIPSDAWQVALGGKFTPAEFRTPAQIEALALSAALADELLAADAYIFATPLYNWGVNQFVKTWVDLVLLDDRFAPGSTPLAGRSAALVVTRGGGYGPGTPKEGWDHATPWYRRIFEDLWGLDLHVSEVELTLARVNPAMAELVPLAEELLAAGHESADKHGRILAERAA